jgi:hypothetical protein
MKEETREKQVKKNKELGAIWARYENRNGVLVLRNSPKKEAK